MSKFRKRPVEVEAMQWRGPQEILNGGDYAMRFDDWIEANRGDRGCFYRGDKIIIRTLEGEMEASIGDWIIRGVKGEIYPCKPDIFADTYEQVGRKYDN